MKKLRFPGGKRAWSWLLKPRNKVIKPLHACPECWSRSYVGIVDGSGNRWFKCRSCHHIWGAPPKEIVETV